MEDVEAPKNSSLVVHGEGLCFRYFGRKGDFVLKHLDISVGRGIIYGLLGPSGCGKTTLLRCIVGRLTPSSGTIRIHGKVPGQRGFCIPGPGVGFMPQELALYPEITMEETLTYFGRIYGMSSNTIKERIDFLAEFLDIPNKKKLIKNLSGGQQRRVSFAAALIHQPSLVILDEPTVGVDPLLRESIWDHLQDLTALENITVIITTHYLEEARKAHVVGFMRHGRMLAEGNPEQFIQDYKVSLLEEVFLKLCKPDSLSHRTSSDDKEECDLDWESQKNEDVWILRKMNQDSYKSDSSYRYEPTKAALLNDADPDLPEDTNCAQQFKTTVKQMAALIDKNCIRLKRNIPMVFFTLAFPVAQVLAFCICIGGEPFDLPMAVVNLETDPAGKAGLFLQELDNYTLILNNFPNMSSALDSIKTGDNWGVIYIPEKFTDRITDRFLMGADADNETVEESTIRMYMDMTNQQISITVYAKIFEAFTRFSKKILQLNFKNDFLADLPISVESPIYGEVKPNFTKYMAPGMIMGITYIMAVSLSTMSIIIEKKEGLMERSWVAGVGSWAVLSSILFTLLILLLVQVVLVLVIIFYSLNISCMGSLLWVIIATLLAGFEGLAYGLLVSAICSNENTAVMLTMGSFYPIICVSGMFWSVEAMPTYVRVLSYATPLTLLTHTTRCVLYRGWGILDNNIWAGYLVGFCWTVPIIIIASIIFKYKK